MSKTTTDSTPTAAPTLLDVPITDLHDNPDNVRDGVPKDAAFKEMVVSMSGVGVVQPLILTPSAEGGYTIIAGHRRRAAAAEAGLTVVPAVVHEGLTDSQILEMALVENLQRADLSVLEEARGYYRLAALDGGRTVKYIAGKVGRGQKYVSDRLALLELPKSVLEGIAKDEISFADAKHLRTAIEADLPTEVVDELIDAARKHGHIEHRVSQVIGRLQVEATLDKAREAAESKGRPFYLHRGNTYDLPRTVGIVEIPEGEDVSGGATNFTEPHTEAEPCHGVLLVYNGHSKPRSFKACVDLTRHSKKGDSEVKIAVDEAKTAQQQRDREARQREAQEREQHDAELVAATVHTKWTATETQDLIAQTLIARLDHDSARAATRALGLEPVKVENPYGERNAKGEVKMQADHVVTLREYCKVSQANTRRAAVLAALIHVESMGNYGAGDTARSAAYGRHDELMAAAAAVEGASSDD